MNSFNAFLIKGLEILNIISAFITVVVCTYILYNFFAGLGRGYGSMFYKNEPGAFFSALTLSLIITIIFHGVIALLVDIRQQLKAAAERSQ
tara:strand:- start:1698 stop:1970 length:273 start_codon:yes stop_codon:yes gene_type:complete